MLLGMMKSCTQPSEREYPEIVIYHIDDIFYVSGNHVSSESGRFDSLCVDRDAALQYLEDLTVEATGRMPFSIKEDLKTAILVYDDKLDLFYLELNSAWDEPWNVTATFKRAANTNVFIPVKAKGTIENYDREGGDSSEGWELRR